jgi:hypothetical protein
MSEGNIIFGSINGPGGGGIVVSGAHNGLSVDAGGFIVLGQDVGAVGSPAVLLDNREIPMNDFYLNLFRGLLQVSTNEGGFGTAALFEVDYVALGAFTQSAAIITADSTFTGSDPTMLALNATVTGPIGEPTEGIYLSCDINGVNAFRMDYNGFTTWSNPNTGVSFFAINDSVELLGGIGGQAALTIEPTYITSAFPVGTFYEIFLQPKFTVAGTSQSVVEINMTPQIDQTAGGTGSFTGILFNPNVLSITGQLIAYQNVIGDVLLQSNGAGGHTGVHGVTTPSAYIHIGAGAAAASSAPIKLTTGTFQFVAELGAIEYNGTNLTFVRTGTTRENILTGNTAAAPGTVAFVPPLNMYGSGAAALTTPTSWVQVNISGTNYKIPLY